MLNASIESWFLLREQKTFSPFKWHGHVSALIRKQDDTDFKYYLLEIILQKFIKLQLKRMENQNQNLTWNVLFLDTGPNRMAEGDPGPG